MIPMQARRALVRTRGKAKVDSVAEAGYDTNNDGIINAQEAQAMKEDIQ